jgi:hypothetical protein
MILKKIDGKIHQKFHKNASRGMPSFSDLIALMAAATAANAAADTHAFLQMTREQCDDFVSGVVPDKLADALQTYGEKPYFVFLLATIYVRAGATRSFPKNLADLLYDAVFREEEGYQQFLELLNCFFVENKKKVVRSLWGLCEGSTPADIESFLKPMNSSPLMLFYWLQLAVKRNKQIVKELFQILARIAKQNISPNSKVDYSDVVRAIRDNKTYFLFHETNGVFAVVLETGYVGNLLNLFEVDWNFTMAELTLVRDFLRKRPINASWLLQTDYMSAGCSRYLIGHVMNLPDLLDHSGRLTKDVLLLPANVLRIAEFVIFSHDHLHHLFRVNQYLFNIIVFPPKYRVCEILLFFMNMHMLRIPELFSKMIRGLETYGNKLLPEDVLGIQRSIEEIHPTRKSEAELFAACMCISRQEQILYLKDHILVLKAIYARNGAHTLQVTPSSEAQMKYFVDVLRKHFPEFILYAKVLFVNQVSLLPVVKVEPMPESVITFLKTNSSLFVCLLQLMMLSNTLNQLWENMVPVMDFIGQQADRLPPTDVQFKINLAEMFNILHVCFCKFGVKVRDFSDKIDPLLPKNPENSVFEAFIAEQRFQDLTRGVHDERKVAQMEQACKEYCTEHGTTMNDAQLSLGFVLLSCDVCTCKVTRDFTTIIDCGHAICTGCAGKLASPNCPNCRAQITNMMRPSFEIRFRKDPEDSSEKSAESAEKKQRTN